VRNSEKDKALSGFHGLDLRSGLIAPNHGQIMGNNAQSNPSLEAIAPMIKTPTQPMFSF
jgi:hypothetical protein